MNKAVAVIFAGGVGVRMQTKALPKQFLCLHGKPILIHTLENFQKNNSVDGIVLVMVKEWMAYAQDLCAQYGIDKLKTIVAGGANGQESIYYGLKAAAEYYGEGDVVLIHDGVRPLVSQQLIEDNIASVRATGTAISSARATETMFLTEDGKFGHVVERDRTWVAKAPQSFYLVDILEMHERARCERQRNFVDSCSMMQYYGKELSIVECGRDNIKITTPEDYYIFRAIFEKNENEQLL